ncbi:dienelactone hydrolase family protein [Paenibacillus sp. GYB003]|uniref:dienelactone hydrolase family protein n=1 Tax=Paenibacillus sp. GYB003 TaxID=2994392 RepID=UPI002F962170
MQGPEHVLRQLSQGRIRSDELGPDAADWPGWRERLAGRFAQRLGGFPERGKEPDPSHTVTERTRKDGYVREKVEVTTYAGVRMPMYVLVPDGAKPGTPAVVACHGHGYGSREIVGLEPDGSERAGDPTLHRDFAVELVRRGFVVAAPELLGFGDRRFPEDKAAGPKQSSCLRLSVHLLMLGMTIAGVRMYETMRAIDYLQSRGDVNPARIGCMGISGGGLVAGFTAALDERVKAAVVSGYANTFADSVLTRAHCVDNYIPGVLLDAEMPDLLGLIAPRALLIESGARDQVFPAEGAVKAYERLGRIYAAAGAGDKLEADFFAGGHEISGAKSYDWLWKTLARDDEGGNEDEHNRSIVKP